MEARGRCGTRRTEDRIGRTGLDACPDRSMASQRGKDRRAAVYDETGGGQHFGTDGKAVGRWELTRRLAEKGQSVRKERKTLVDLILTG
jgi:hypothetical protein